MKLLVVIVNYRVTELTIDCLRSVAGEIVPGIKVAVCENGTGAEDAARIRRAIDDNGWSAWCTLTAINPNLGFTGGNNVILRPTLEQRDAPDYFLLLNADTIVRPGAFKAMIDFLDAHSDVGIVGCRLEQPDGYTQRSAFRFQSAVSEFEATVRLGIVTRLFQKWMVAPPPRNETFQTDWVSGASMMVRREVFRDAGLLDEGLYTYFDDCDLCFNAKKKGWGTWYVPTGTVLHLKGQSTGIRRVKPNRFPPYYFQARRRYLLKNYGPFSAAMADAGQIFGQALWRLRVLLTGKTDGSPPHYLGDSVRHSVFATGVKIKAVQNPALVSRETGAPAGT